MSDTPERGGQDRAPLRQFSVTITQSTRADVLEVLLRWRTFPCAASHWDGSMSARVPTDGTSINSQEALRMALLDVAGVEWHVGPVGRP